MILFKNERKYLISLRRGKLANAVWQRYLSHLAFNMSCFQSLHVKRGAGVLAGQVRVLVLNHDPTPRGEKWSESSDRYKRSSPKRLFVML